MANPFITSSWSLRFELPKDKAKGRDWSQNMSATVVCHTAERACEIIREAHADAVIFAVNHKGKDVTYLDPLATSTLQVVSADSLCQRNRSYAQKHLPNDLGRCSFCAAVVEPVLPESVADE